MLGPTVLMFSSANAQVLCFANALGLGLQLNIQTLRTFDLSTAPSCSEHCLVTAQWAGLGLFNFD